MVDDPTTALPTDPATEAAFQNLTAPAPETPRAPASVAPAPSAVNVLDPSGELVSISSDQLTDALQQGYRTAGDEDIHNYIRNQKYGTTGQQAITALEGAGQGATFGLSTAAEIAAGVDPNDIKERAAENPGSHMAGEAAGLVGSSFIPVVGEANLLEKAGQGVAGLVGLGNATGTIAKIGSAAVKGAVENMLFQSGDEGSKAFVDPEQSVSMALSNIGLSGLIGGGIGGSLGAVAPLWKATLGSKTEGVLAAIRDKVGGVEGQIPDAVSEAIDRSGLQVDPQVKAALSSDPYVRQLSQTLMDSATGSGLEHQQALMKFRGDIANKIVETLGKSPDDVESLSNLNPNEVGEAIKSDIASKIKEMNDPIAKQYETISNRFKGTEIPAEIHSDLSQKLGQLVLDGASPESPQAKLLQRVLKETPALKNLEQLRNYGSDLRVETSGIANQPLWGISRQIRNALSDATDNTLTKVVGDQAPELSQTLKDSNAAYKNLKGTIEDINDRLKVGPHAGPKTFLSALNDMDGEKVLARLNPANKADIISELKQTWPSVAEKVRDYHVGQLLKGAAKNAPEGAAISSQKFFNKLNDLSPQYRDFMTNGQGETLKGLQALHEGLPAKIGKSGTPQGVDSLMAHLPASAMGVAAMLSGHGAPVSALAGYVTKLLGRDAPDAARLALLKFLGSDAPLSGSGFKAAFDMAYSTLRGENAVSSATKNLFKTGKEVLPQSLMPNESDRKKLSKSLNSLRVDQTPLTSVAKDTAHYLPDHGNALGAISANAVNYLQQLKPSTDKPAPLDSKPQISTLAQTKYDAALNIAEKPLSVLPKIKEGNLTPDDVTHLKTLYPSLYNTISSKLLDSATEHLNSGKTIPYKTRLGLSLFTGQALDSTMTQQGIALAQPMPATPPQSPPVKSKGGGNSSPLNKLPKTFMTASQSAEADRGDRS